MELGDLETIKHRQNLFCMTLKSHLMTKITKYQNLMINQGVYIDDQSDSEDVTELRRSPSVEDKIELVLGHDSSSCKTFWKMGNRISTVKLFRWIYKIILQTKAAGILSHLNGVPDSEVKATVEAMAREIAVAYEYQLMVLYSDVEVVKLAQHTAACILVYLNSRDAKFTRETLLQAILEVKPLSSKNKDILRTRPVLYEGRPVCLRWRLSQVLKQPGLRIGARHTATDDSMVKNRSTGECREKQGENITHGLTVTKTGQDRKADHRESHMRDFTDISNNQDEPDQIKTFDKAQHSANENKNLDTSSREKKENGFSDVENLHISLEEVSAVLLRGTVDDAESATDNSKADKLERRISAIEMDYENSSMHISQHSVEVEVPDFSSLIDTDVSASDGMVTELDEDRTLSYKVSVAEAVLEDTADECTFEGYSDNELFSLDDFAEESNTNVKMCNKVEIEGNKVGQSNNDLDDTEHLKQRISSRDVNGGATCEPTSNFYIDANSCHCKEVADGKYQSTVKVNDGSDMETTKPFKFYGCFTPYGAKCRPKVYGFRGPLHVWNEKEGQYTLIYNDTVTVSCSHRKEIASKQDDPHQAYSPLTVCRH